MCSYSVGWPAMESLWSEAVTESTPQYASVGITHPLVTCERSLSVWVHFGILPVRAAHPDGNSHFIQPPTGICSLERFSDAWHAPRLSSPLPPPSQGGESR